jgi:hypothetical protein
MRRASAALSTIGTITPCTPTVERARQEMVFAAGHANERLDADAATAGGEHLQRLEAQARVFHVEQRELAARGLQHLRHSRREEFEHHRARHGLAAQHLLPDRTRPHAQSQQSSFQAPLLEAGHDNLRRFTGGPA